MCAASHIPHLALLFSEKFEMNTKEAARIIDGLIRTRICFYFYFIFLVQHAGESTNNTTE